MQDGAEDGRQFTYTEYEFTPILYSISSTNFIVAVPDLCLQTEGRTRSLIPSLLPARRSGAAVLEWVFAVNLPLLVCFPQRKNAVLVTQSALWSHLHWPAEERQGVVSGLDLGSLIDCDFPHNDQARLRARHLFGCAPKRQFV